MNLSKHIVSLDTLTRNASRAWVISNWKRSEEFLAPTASSVIMTSGEKKIAFLKGAEVTNL